MLQWRSNSLSNFAALRDRLRFVAAVCETTTEQIEGIRDVLEKYRSDLAKKYSDGLKRNINAAVQRRTAPGFPDPRKVVRDSVARTVKTNLTVEQVARFEKEIETRNSDRSRAAVHTLIARLDEALTLSGDQREKLVHSLSSNLNAPGCSNSKPCCNREISWFPITSPDH